MGSIFPLYIILNLFSIALTVKDVVAFNAIHPFIDFTVNFIANIIKAAIIYSHNFNKAFKH